MKQLVVIGGGAAGIFGAIACAEANPDIRITVLEAGATPLSKVKISGGGRCNVTHACFDPSELVTHYPRGHRALRGAFRQFQPQDTINWFAQRGVRLKTEQDGRIFPVTDQSQTIIDCLLDAALRYRIILRTRTPVVSVQVSRTTPTLIPSPTDSAFQATTLTQPMTPFHLTLKSGEALSCDRLLLATGSHPIGHRIAQALGHTLESPVPSLFTFTVHEPELRALAGIAIEKVGVHLLIPDRKPLEQMGPLLITHWGMSGPAILKLSAWGARELHTCRYQAQLRINWLPDTNESVLREQLMKAKTEWARKAIATLCPVGFPKRFWHYLLSRAEIAHQTRWAQVSKKSIHQLIQILKQDHYAIQGKGVFKDEFVTCGGICLKEINFKTMESRPCPGLYVAGEVLDVDGVTGGFNFQNAWTTSWIAGQAIASS